jgi:hypothetical protein
VKTDTRDSLFAPTSYNGGAVVYDEREKQQLKVQAQGQEVRAEEVQVTQPQIGAERLNAHLRCLAALTEGCSGAEVRLQALQYC